MSFYAQLQDHELVYLLKENNHTAYRVIYERYWSVLFRHARRILQSDEEAKDIIQDIFSMLWSKRSELIVQTTLSAFLYSAVRNKIFDLLDRNRVRGNYLDSLQYFIDLGEFTTDNLIREKELGKRIEQEVALLPPKMREVFELSRNGHFSYKQIAEKMNISDNTVKKQINNALKILRYKFGIIFFLFFMFF